MYQQEKSSESKTNFRQASNHYKRVLDAARLAYSTKTKESITSQKLGSRDFWWIANSVLNKGKSAIPHLFNSPEVLYSASDKAQLFAKNFSNSNLDELGVSLPVFVSRTNLKLHISITPKMVEKVIMNLDSSKTSLDCILVLVLKNCEHQLSYIRAELFNMCLKKSYFPDCWKVSLVVPVFKNISERSTAKNYCPVSLLFVASKVFEKLVNNRIVDHLENSGVFFWFLMFLHLLNQLQIFWQLGLLELLGLITGLGLFELCHDISNPFELGMLVFFTNLGLMKYQVKYLVLFLLFSVIGHFGWFWVGSLHKNTQLMLEFLKHPFLVPHFFYQAWKFGRNNYFVTASFLLLIKEGNDNSFP